jgi:hypothetical protein
METTIKPPEHRSRALRSHLFPGEAKLNTFAVLDGASIPGLLGRLRADKPEHVCLYRGELKPDLAQRAPYLVRLDPASPFADWLLTEGYNKHWGIFALAPVNFGAMRKHFRTFLLVKDPDGKQVYFRYYDPRVLRLYLPTCNAQETAIVFGPIRNYLLESESPANLLRFWPDKAPPRKETIQLPQA